MNVLKTECIIKVRQNYNIIHITIYFIKAYEETSQVLFTSDMHLT